MKYVFLFSVAVLISLNSFAQKYRVNYTSESLPELYNEITIAAEEQMADGNYRPLRGKYILATSDAQLHGRKLTIDHDKLYANNGVLDMTLNYNGQIIPVKLELPILKEIRYNLYADSIKPIMNYYLNVEGVYTNGRIYPLDQNYVTVASDYGIVEGMEWVKPDLIDFEKVSFHTAHNYVPIPAIDTTLYIKKYKDPRDAMDK